jgi:hypothetical protein
MQQLQCFIAASKFPLAVVSEDVLSGYSSTSDHRFGIQVGKLVSGSSSSVLLGCSNLCSLNPKHTKEVSPREINDKQ